MSNNKVYKLKITKYKDNTSKYMLYSYQSLAPKEFENTWMSNLQISNLHTILISKDKYELKIKLDLLGLSFIRLTSDIINNNKMYNNSIKSVASFKLNSSYEN